MREIAGYLRGNVLLEEAADAAKAETRRYAKRQMTWFRRDEEMQWFDARDGDKLLDWVRDKVPL